MRTKTILLSAAVLAAGLSASVAQSVFSVNAVGYVNIPIVHDNNLIANPLNGTNNNINTIIPTAPAGSVVQKWDSVAQGLSPLSASFVAGLGWVNDAFETSTMILLPGEAFFLNNPLAATTLTFVGEVPQGNLVNPIGANYSFVSSIVPQSASLTALGFPGQNGMNYFGWDKVAQGYAGAYAFFGGAWNDPNFAQVDPVPGVGEGFVILNPGAAVSWTRTFSVN